MHDPGAVPEAYLVPTPIYTMCIHRSGVDLHDRYTLALKYAERFGYRGPKRGWEPPE